MTCETRQSSSKRKSEELTSEGIISHVPGSLSWFTAAQVRFSVRPDQIKPFMTPGPSLVESIEADEDFRDEHFGSFYADGLTPDQAEALRGWCERNAIAAVPLAPTISFANWIYLGYFLTALLQGHVLMAAY